MNKAIKNFILGMFVLAAITVFVYGVLFLKPTIGDGKQILHIRFSNINGLNVGTQVLFGGKAVGEVAEIHEIQNARSQPTDELGRVYFYQLTLKVDSQVEVYNTDEISIQTSGLLGEKSIAITPKAAPKGITPKLIKSKPIYADSVDMFQNAVLDFSDLASAMEETFNKLGQWLTDHGKEVADAISAADIAMRSFDRAMETLHTGNTFENIGIAVQNVKSSSQSLNQALGKIAQGKGTIGELIESDGLYLQANATLSKVNNLMSDINHYGILFHLNKQWQRTHLKKINELSALRSPENFRSYFQTEVDTINVSMTRLSSLIDRAQGTSEKRKILDSREFQRDFIQLMRNAQSLSETLKLYNQQFTEEMQNTNE